MRIDGIKIRMRRKEFEERIKWREENERKRNEGRVMGKNRKKTLKDHKLHELIGTIE